MNRTKESISDDSYGRNGQVNPARKSARFVLGAATAGLAVILAACGSTPLSSPGAAHSSSGSPTSTSTRPGATGSNGSTAAKTPAFTYIGTLVGGGNAAPNETDTIAFSVGNAVGLNDPAAPPSAAIDACTNSTVGLGNLSVAVPGQLKFTATFPGTIPATETISPGIFSAHGSETYGGSGAIYMAIPNGGGWDCSFLGGDGNDDPTYSVRSGQTVVVNFWILAGAVLSESSPTFVPAQHPDYAFGSTNPSAYTAASGQNAARCSLNGQSYLQVALFVSPPYSYTYETPSIPNGVAVNCMAP